MRFESLRRRDPIRWLTITAVFMAMNIALLVPVLAVVTVHSDAEGTDRNLGLGVLQLGVGAQPAHHDSVIQHKVVLLFIFVMPLFGVVLIIIVPFGFPMIFTVGIFASPVPQDRPAFGTGLRVIRSATNVTQERSS